MKENPIRPPPASRSCSAARRRLLAGGCWRAASGPIRMPTDWRLPPASSAPSCWRWSRCSLIGLYTVEPNQAAVLSLFGKYVGTVKEQGLRWNNPFYSKRKITQRMRNFESSKLKVNDLDGSPIEIAAVVVWQVVDSAEAVYNVDDYESFVHIQSESALRAMATSYPYDQHEDGQLACAATPPRSPST